MGDINSSSLLDYEVLGTPRTAFQRYQPGSFIAAAMQNLRRPDGGAFQMGNFGFFYSYC